MGLWLVYHNFGLTTGSQNAMHRGDGFWNIRSVVENAPGVDGIKRSILKREVLTVGQSRIRVKAEELKAAADEFDGSLGQVDPGQDGSVLGK